MDEEEINENQALRNIVNGMPPLSVGILPKSNLRKKKGKKSKSKRKTKKKDCGCK